jgi:hypothetical protein
MCSPLVSPWQGNSSCLSCYLPAFVTEINQKEGPLSSSIARSGRLFENSNKAYICSFSNKLISGLSPAELTSALSPTKLISALSPTKLISALSPTKLISALSPTKLVSALSPTKLISALSPTQLISALSPTNCSFSDNAYICSFSTTSRHLRSGQIGRSLSLTQLHSEVECPTPPAKLHSPLFTSFRCCEQHLFRSQRRCDGRR